jgi:pimeloyl-ACP methyl ester carboxylesterase
VPTSVDEMAANAIAFIRALGLGQVDVLGFSLGGLIAQEIALAAPALVRRLVLVGTGPRSGEGMATLTPEAQAVFGAAYDNPNDLWLDVFFKPSKRSQAAGRDYLKRFRHRAEGRDPEVSHKVASAQIEALGKGGSPREPLRLSEGDHPADAGRQRRQRRHHLPGELVILRQHLPNAQLILYPYANHGS